MDIISKKKDLAPIAIFVYNRVENLDQLFKSLLKNKEAKDTIVYIFSDGPKNQNDVQKVYEVRKIINNIKGFKKIEIIESEKNNGLANSIIRGVTQVINRYGKIIVLEDDLIVSNVFIRYMNTSLEKFEKKDIWSISGYSPKIKVPSDYTHDFYLTMRACSWGWATWKDQWKTVDWNEEIKGNKKIKKDFNNCGTDLYNMLINQKKGYIDSWAIRWCYSQFLQKKYTVYPNRSFLSNDGFSNEGTHGSIDSLKFKTNIQQNLDGISFEIPKHNMLIQKEFNKIYNLKASNYIAIFLRKIGLYNYFKKLYKKIK